ncbi:hypothetical protein GGE15_006778 [Rhizobium esperanzae]|uniref:Uncharacterized protein n=1 Tax=Rhizobium esperanzae TaxID=1967781 RepID=A0A7W6UU84_9HYPH|nr:hypothetical protein [Rhizobium esperanzae]
MPIRTPALKAAASIAATVRFDPLRATTTTGVSAKIPGSARLILSVDSVGRKTDTTRGIAGTYFKFRGFSRSCSDQFRQPARAPDARHGKRFGRKNADPPPRRGSGGLTKIRSLGRAPPSSKRNSDRSRRFSRKLQPSGSRHRQSHQLGDDGAKPAKTQTLLEIREHILFPVGLNINHPVMMEARLRQCRRKQIRPCQAPKDVALCARNNPGDKQRGGCAMHRIATTTSHFVQGTASQPTARKLCVDLGYSERQHLALARSSAFKPPDAVLQLGNDRVGGSDWHRFPTSRVHLHSQEKAGMFCFCSLNSDESTGKNRVDSSRHHETAVAQSIHQADSIRCGMRRKIS